MSRSRIAEILGFQRKLFPSSRCRLGYGKVNRISSGSIGGGGGSRGVIIPSNVKRQRNSGRVL